MNNSIFVKPCLNLTATISRNCNKKKVTFKHQGLGIPLHSLFGEEEEDMNKIFWTEWWQGLLEVTVHLISLGMQLLPATFIFQNVLG